MKSIFTHILSIMILVLSTAAYAKCPDGEIEFTFENLPVKIAFKVLADFGGVKAEVDRSIKYSAPIKFGCTPWLTAANNLAEKYKLTLKIENGVMHVSR